MTTAIFQHSRKFKETVGKVLLGSSIYQNDNNQKFLQHDILILKAIDQMVSSPIHKFVRIAGEKSKEQSWNWNQ